MKPGYKQTEVGVIPEEWQCARMSEIAKLESGHTPSKREPSYWGGSIPWVSLFDTEGLQGREIFETAKMVTEEGLNNSSARLLPKGTVVFSRTATVGKTTVMGRDMATSQDFANYICGPKLHNHFLVYLFRNMGRTWKSLMAGSIHNTIYMPVFKALQIILPPLPEQRAIATALSDVDGLLGGLDRLIAKKRDLKQAAMQQLLTGQTRLPGFHAEWEVVTAREIGVFRGGSGFPLEAQGESTGDYPFFKVSDMNNEGNETFMTSANHWISEHTRKRLGANAFPANAIVLAKVGAAIFLERKKILGQPSCIDNNMAAFALDQSRADVRFVHTLLLSKKLGSLVATTALPALNGKQLGEMILTLPPLPEQRAIATVLTEMDRELAVLTQRREKTRALKQAMMQELLTGRTRLL